MLIFGPVDISAHPLAEAGYLSLNPGYNIVLYFSCRSIKASVKRIVLKFIHASDMHMGSDSGNIRSLMITDRF